MSFKTHNFQRIFPGSMLPYTFTICSAILYKYVVYGICSHTPKCSAHVPYTIFISSGFFFRIYRNKSTPKIIHKLSWVQYIIMHEYKLNCLIVDNRICHSEVISGYLIVLFFLMSVSLPFVNSVQLL